MKTRGYKVKLSNGKRLIAELNDRGWTVKLQGENGDWKPGIHSKEPLWEDARKWEKLHELFGIDRSEWDAFRASVEAQEKDAIKQSEEKHEPKTDDAVHTKAKVILETGDPIKYIVESCGRYVLGGENAFRKLACCVSVQDIAQSAGLHPRLSGESGMGKSLLVLVFAHHLPPEIVSIGSSSNLAVFYHNEGNRIFRVLDDYVAGGNETIDTIIKQTSTVYHQVYAHKTVKDMEPATLYIGSEQTWAITAVDASQDIQVLNRQIPINVDDSEDLTKKVNISTINRYAEGREQFFTDEVTEICREMWRILRSGEIIDVKIPFGDRIEWLDNSNRRNPSIFMDLVIARTAMMRYQRQTDSTGVFLAEEEDFRFAENLFKDKDAEELVKRLTKKERQLAEIVTKYPEGITREDVAVTMKISVQRISQLLNGEKGRGGLISKMPSLKITDTTNTTRDSDVHSVSTRCQMLKLAGYKPIDGFDMVVSLKAVKHELRPDLRNDDFKENDNGEREREEYKDIVKAFKENVRENKKSFSSEENTGDNILIEKNIEENISEKEKENISLSGSKKSLNSLNEGSAYRKQILKSPLNGPLTKGKSFKEEEEMLRAMSDDAEKEEKFRLKRCDECGKSVTALHEIGEGEFVMRMCKVCYGAYLNDVSGV